MRKISRSHHHLRDGCAQDTFCAGYHRCEANHLALCSPVIISKSTTLKEA